MLDIKNFDRYDSFLVYCGFNHYIISKDGRDYVIDVRTLDKYGEVQEGPRYIASSLSSAIATIEEQEATA